MYRIRTNVAQWDQDAVSMEIEIQDASRRTVNEAIQRHLRRVLDEVPSCPVKSGNLYDHHFARVEEVGGIFYGEVGVEDVDYAIFVHEGVNRWGSVSHYTRPGSGPFWISSKDFEMDEKVTRDVEKAISGVISRWRR